MNDDRTIESRDGFLNYSIQRIWINDIEYLKAEDVFEMMQYHFEMMQLEKMCSEKWMKENMNGKNLSDPSEAM